MKAVTTLCVLCVLVMAGVSSAEPIKLIIDPEKIGFFGTEEGNHMSVSVQDAGYTRVHFRNVGDSVSLGLGVFPFVAYWPEDIGWTKVTFPVYNGELNFPSDTDVPLIDFNPFGLIGLFGPVEGGVTYLPPRQYFIFMNGFECNRPCPGTLSLEYFVETIPAPIIGDFNYDNVVNLDDFDILKEYFHVDLVSSPRWDRGDANLDGRATFADFLLLSTHFGESRQQEAATVPEPMGPSPIAFAFLAMTLICRRSRK